MSSAAEAEKPFALNGGRVRPVPAAVISDRQTETGMGDGAANPRRQLIGLAFYIASVARITSAWCMVMRNNGIGR